MGISTIENFYKETITRAVSLTGATNIYVSALPTPDEGYVVISPSSSSLREIVYYTAKGTDGNGSYLTVTADNRGLGGTTAQTHAIGEPVRMNVTAEHIKEISDALDQIVAQGTQDASTITKGIAKLSVAPASATEPIAVGDNDPRLPTITQVSFMQTGFGDGSDGDVTISSPTTLTRDMYYNNLVVNSTLNSAQYRIFVKETLSGNGIIKTPNGNNGTNANGATRGTGGACVPAGYFPATVSGVDGGNGGDGIGNSGGGPINVTNSVGKNGKTGGSGGSGVLSGGNGGIPGTATSVSVKFLISRFLTLYGLDVSSTGSLVKITGNGSSSGGGSGGGDNSSGGASSGGGGGSGSPAGILSIFASTIEGTFSLKAIGGNGGNGGNSGGGNNGGGGGGAGGNGGYIYLVYAKDNGWVESYDVSGGTGGTGGTGLVNGTPGQNGDTGTFKKILVNNLI